MLAGKHIVLRPVEVEDLDKLYQWENDPENWQYSDHLNPFSRFYLEQYILNASNDIYADKQLRLMITEKGTGEAAGIIDLFEFEPKHRRAAVGIVIDKDKRRKGYASEALRLIIDYAGQTLNLKQLYCGVDSENKGSIDLFRQLGFEVSGNRKSWRLQKGRWKDELFLQLIFESNS